MVSDHRCQPTSPCAIKQRGTTPHGAAVADVFISYAHDDRARVMPVAQALVDHGFSVWWDREARHGLKPGEDFDLKIEQELESAACVLVGWSAASRRSAYVRDEARRGLRREVLVPVLLDNVDPPLGFGTLHTEDLSQWEGNTQADPWQRLVLQAEAFKWEIANNDR